MRWLLPPVGLLFALVGAALMVLYAFPHLQLTNHQTALAASFIPYGILAWAVAAVAFWLAGRRWLKLLALVAAIGLVVQVVWAQPYWPRTPAAAAPTRLTVLTMNLRCDEPALTGLMLVVERERPDVVVLQDFSQDAWDMLQGTSWMRALPWHSPQPKDQPQADRSDPCGPIVFANTPVTPAAAATAGQPIVSVDLPGLALTVAPVSMPSPIVGVEPWLQGFTDLGQALTAHEPADAESLLVVGDFNATREHQPMRQLIAEHRLVDAAEQSGAGWLPTFPANRRYPPLIPIDHVLMGPGLRASYVTAFSVRYGAHRGLIARLGPA